MEIELIESNLSASEFHAREVADVSSCQVWWNHLTQPALVLGSTQRDAGMVDAVACRRAGIEVVRRRSGGGAVLLIPGEVGWIDVIVPKGAPGWTDDVHATMVWLGEHLAAVIERAIMATDTTPDRGTHTDTSPVKSVQHAPFGEPASGNSVIPSVGQAAVTGSSSAGAVVTEPTVAVNRAGMLSTGWSRLICFDGLGPGEVQLNGGKLVGISQRRTRNSARLQVLWYSHYDPTRILKLLAADTRPAVQDLQQVATVDPEVSASIPRLLVERLGVIGEEMGDNG